MDGGRRLGRGAEVERVLQGCSVREVAEIPELRDQLHGDRRLLEELPGAKLMKVTASYH